MQLYIVDFDTIRNYPLRVDVVEKKNLILSKFSIIQRQKSVSILWNTQYSSIYRGNKIFVDFI